MGRIDRKSSIENEPRTLKMHQIQFAREAALYVINTTTIEEALAIFTKGLEPVECKAIKDKDSVMESYCYHKEEDEEEEEIDDFDDLQSLFPLRDIVSAPL